MIGNYKKTNDVSAKPTVPFEQFNSFGAVTNLVEINHAKQALQAWELKHGDAATPDRPTVPFETFNSFGRVTNLEHIKQAKAAQAEWDAEHGQADIGSSSLSTHAGHHHHDGPCACEDASQLMAIHAATR
jgi:hypothetical protein